MAVSKAVQTKPKRTPNEWGMLKEHQLPNAVLLELNTDQRRVDSDGNVFLVKMPPKRVFFPKSEVEAAKKRGYKEVTDGLKWNQCAPRDEPREPIAIIPILEGVEDEVEEVGEPEVVVVAATEEPKKKK